MSAPLIEQPHIAPIRSRAARQLSPSMTRSQPLFEQVGQGPLTTEPRDDRGTVHILPALGAKAHLIAACPSRYILDLAASRFCLETMLTGAHLHDTHGLALRLPAENLWIEWAVAAAFDGAQGHVRGALVETDAQGRTGLITAFWSDVAGHAGSFPASIYFDLDGAPLAPARFGRDWVGMRHGELAAVDWILARCMLCMDPAWSHYFRCAAGDSPSARLACLANLLWPYLPTILAFAVNLQRPPAQTRGDLPRRLSPLSFASQLRVSRSLDARLDLGAGEPDRALPQRVSPRRIRSNSRLHHVRGHFVRRSGKTFWRKPHLRGDAATALRCRNVQVTASVPTLTLMQGEPE